MGSSATNIPGVAPDGPVSVGRVKGQGGGGAGIENEPTQWSMHGAGRQRRRGAGEGSGAPGVENKPTHYHEYQRTWGNFSRHPPNSGRLQLEPRAKHPAASGFDTCEHVHFNFLLRRALSTGYLSWSVHLSPRWNPPAGFQAGAGCIQVTNMLAITWLWHLEPGCGPVGGVAILTMPGKGHSHRVYIEGVHQLEVLGSSEVV
ncbi:hypothetical protein GGX14DRAFT_388601 [Mycena pura]|uniref:Uncharacterized protein n=1 Tax=Mycena pura TaxID=153505 RepID=A0AAD6VSF9_9AGAR|nr:hypothetical protein GGX14DRAFT_388601 [Mycena pura]